MLSTMQAPSSGIAALEEMARGRASGSTAHGGVDEGGGDDDLLQSYQNAVDCIVHCEYIMKSLQEQLAAKDERIESLEEKIVRMSLELASARTLQDEQAQELSRYRSNPPGLSSGPPSEEGRPPEEQDWGMALEEGPPGSAGSSLMVEFSPTEEIGCPRHDDNGNGTTSAAVMGRRRGGRTHRSNLSRSWTGPGEKSMGDVILSWPSEAAAVTGGDDDYDVVQVGPKPRPHRLGRCMSGLRVSWKGGIDSNITQPTLASSLPLTLDDSHHTHNTDRASILSAGTAASSDNSGSSGKFANFGQLLLGFSNKNEAAATEGAETYNNEVFDRGGGVGKSNRGEPLRQSSPAIDAPQRQSALSPRKLSRHLSLEKVFSAPSTRKTFGQFLLGGSAREDRKTVLNDGANAKYQDSSNQRVGQQRHQMDVSMHSSKSFLSGVLFPQSSDDCILGLLGEDAKVKTSSSSRNEEWPNF